MNKPDCDVIYLALNRTNSEYSSFAVSLAKEISKENRVFYINHPYSLKDLLQQFKKDKKLQKIFTQITIG